MRLVDKYFDPLTAKRIRKFLHIKRSFYSLIILFLVYGISLFAEVVANDKPLVIASDSGWYFPAFKVYKGTDFGLTTPFEPNYKDLGKSLKEKGATVIKPLIYWGYNESNRNLYSYPAPPGKDNWLGTDDRGRDVFVRLLYGLRISLSVAIVTLLCAVIIGTLIGGTQGFFGGKLDLVGQRLVEVWVSMPYLFMVLLIVSVFEPSIMVLVFLLAAFSWMPASYYMRAECLRLKNQEFAVAAKALGASRMQVFFDHIIPNALTPLVTLAPFIMSMSVSTLSFLDYMGLGVQPPTASIGELLKQGRDNFISSWWLAAYPFLALVTILVLINFIGEGVRKAFDPRATID